MANYLTGMTLDQRESVGQRLWSKVEIHDCWIWIAKSVDSHGYGKLSVGPAGGNHMRKAHRIAWELLVGPTPDDLEPDHLCRVSPCVNPDHLEWVTHAENIRRSPITMGALQARKQRCSRNHPYDIVAQRTDGGWTRRCSICIALSAANRQR